MVSGVGGVHSGVNGNKVFDTSFHEALDYFGDVLECLRTRHLSSCSSPPVFRRSSPNREPPFLSSNQLAHCAWTTYRNKTSLYWVKDCLNFWCSADGPSIIFAEPSYTHYPCKAGIVPGLGSSSVALVFDFSLELARMMINLRTLEICLKRKRLLEEERSLCQQSHPFESVQVFLS